MKDSLNIGSGPTEENGASVGDENYAVQGRKECRALIGQLRRMYGEEPFGARLYVKSNPHDFGTYYEVECEFSESQEESVDYAFKCESPPSIRAGELCYRQTQFLACFFVPRFWHMNGRTKGAAAASYEPPS